MLEETDGLFLELKLVDLSNELARLQSTERLSALEKARRLITISREIRAVSAALRGRAYRAPRPSSRATSNAAEGYDRRLVAVAAE